MTHIASICRLVCVSALLALPQLACDSGSPTAPRPPSTRDACLADAVFGAAASSPYCLPFAAGSGYPVSQSYCSPSGSHHTRFAYDFDMPMGTEILASRAGEVVELREHFADSDTQGGHENVVILRHSDETLGLYIHMRHEGVLVELGDFVPRGGLLGYSGQSGSFHPHLHFQICLRGGLCSTGTTEITLPVNFRNADGPLDSRGGLIAGETYTARFCG
jgi:murein DD-endopeptidase MepM/ murein hydrolase activator NlpD